jgi:hypothetical protein
MPESAQVIPFPEGRREGSFLLSDTGLTAVSQCSYEEWEALGQRLRQINRASAWWIGDWLCMGSRLFPERYTQAVDETGLALQTLRNYAWVASRIEPERRRVELSWSHHAELAALEVTAQEQLLARAREHGLTVPQLRKAARVLVTDQRRQEAAQTGANRLAGTEPVPRESGATGELSLVAGDFREILRQFPAGSIDLIFTRPPGDETSLASYGDIARLGEALLKDGGSLLLGVPLHGLAMVLGQVSSYLRYWWTVMAPRSPSVLEGKGVRTAWQPYLWLVRNHRRLGPVLDDCLNEAHGDPVTYLFQQLTVEGETVLDPWSGSGEIVAAACRAGRHAIGIDPDSYNLDVTRRLVGAPA